MCGAFEAELGVVEAIVAACVLANKVRDDHYNAIDYAADFKRDMLVDARHVNQRDILIR